MSETSSSTPDYPAKPPVDNSGGGGSSVPLLALRGISKNFGPVQALQRVDLDIPAGQVTALVGDNGAGKSTLIKAIAGIYAPSSGTMMWNGEEVHPHTPRDAAALGIATVYQDLALCDNIDIVGNMFLGFEATSAGLLDEISMELKTVQTLKDLQVSTVKSVRQQVGSLSGGQRQAIAVARAVMREAKLVIMDEPTAALGVTQTANVLNLIKTLSSRGIAVIVISHNLNDVFAVADRIAVMYLGNLVSNGPISKYDPSSTVELITTGASERVEPHPLHTFA
ncbi:MAG: sugar ABC transporter ATP-binding protein [Acidimicrobiales bacterium 20-64-4]|jgi:ABC-type sugar transport system ATPase subunit|nr:MAG: sugar ABC transporter ATP-binding protein [Acidimicrobiales bacterium 20-64-4]